MLVRGPAGLVVDWEAIDPRGDESEKRAEQREARLQELDDLLDQVRHYRGIRQAEPERGIFDVRLEALIPVVEGTLPVIADADRLSAIESAVSYAVANDLQLIILGGYDAGACADLLKRHEIPVIVAGTHRLPRRRHEPYDHAYTLPARLQAAGVRFCIASERPGGPSGTANVRNLPYHAAPAVAFGLSPQQALRAITLAPAEILGVAEQTGSLTIGKEATLMVTDGDILQTETAVEQAWIAGRQVDLDNRHKQLYRKYQQKYQQKYQRKYQRN
jgi:imidazolonepropionase-like amidohydrolase